MPVPFSTSEVSKRLSRDERFKNCTVHAVESNDLQEVNEILQEVIDKTISQHFVLLSQSITKEQLIDVDGNVQLHVATTATEVKDILLSVTFKEGTSRSLFMIAGREFSEGSSNS